MDSKSPLPKVDHDECEKTEVDKKLQNILPIPKMEKKNVPEHPYCTNWPVGEKKHEDI